MKVRQKLIKVRKTPFGVRLSPNESDGTFFGVRQIVICSPNSPIRTLFGLAKVRIGLKNFLKSPKKSPKSPKVYSDSEKSDCSPTDSNRTSDESDWSPSDVFGVRRKIKAVGSCRTSDGLRTDSDGLRMSPSDSEKRFSDSDRSPSD